MSRRTILSGPYKLVNEAFLREKANRVDDPRHVLYEAMLAHHTYEAYEAATEGIVLNVDSFRTSSITGHMEIMYARKSGWIGDTR